MPSQADAERLPESCPAKELRGTDDAMQATRQVCEGGTQSPCITGSAAEVARRLGVLSGIVPQKFEYVATPTELRKVTADLLDPRNCAEQLQHVMRCTQVNMQRVLNCNGLVALDLEGRELGRHGSVCIIILATVYTVYIIDMVHLGTAALEARSGLRKLLQSRSICKLMFDCRADCEALHALYSVRLECVCDLQVAYYNAYTHNANYLPGLKTMLAKLDYLTEEDAKVKNAGRTFFDPRLGGSYANWELRPLAPLLLRYCVTDVKYFFAAASSLATQLPFSRDVASSRIQNVVDGYYDSMDRTNASVDFTPKRLASPVRRVAS